MDPTQPPALTVVPELTASLTGIRNLPSMLDSIVRAVTRLAPETHAGITVANSDRRYKTVAGTDSLVFALDDVQYALDEGPCLTAIRGDHTVIIDDAESEHRWPRFMPCAVELGLRSHLGVPISIDDKAVAGLNIYSTTHTRLDVDRLDHVKLFAVQASIAMSNAVREKHLIRALGTSRTIGKAIGMIMERCELDEEEAFDYLVGLSQKTNLKVRDIASHLVKQSNDLRHLTLMADPARACYSVERTTAQTLAPFIRAPKAAKPTQTRLHALPESSQDTRWDQAPA